MFATTRWGHMKAPKHKRYFRENNHQILEAILADDVEALAAAVMENEDGIDQPFGFEEYFLPRFLASCPPIISVCCFFKAINCVNFLKDSGCDMKKEDLIGRSPIFFAMAGGDMDVVKQLDVPDEVYEKADKEGNLPIHVACEFGFHDGVNLMYMKSNLLSMSVPNALRCVPMLKAAENGHLDIIKFLKEIGVNWLDSDARGWNGLHYACDRGYCDVAEWFLDNGVDIDRMAHEGETPICVAARSGSLACVKFLVERGCKKYKVRNQRCVPIVEAAQKGHVDVVEYLESLGASIFSSTSNEITAFGAACTSRQIGVIRYMVKTGDVNRKAEYQEALSAIMSAPYIDAKLWKAIFRKSLSEGKTWSKTDMDSLLRNATVYHKVGSNTIDDRVTELGEILELLADESVHFSDNIARTREYNMVYLQTSISRMDQRIQDKIKQNLPELLKSYPETRRCRRW